METSTLTENILRNIERIVIETTEENPVTVAIFTPKFIEVAKGYRVRLKPDYQCSESLGGKGSLP